jgi:predicted AlkP superfamily phosphohydrolase/phosphomutase
MCKILLALGSMIGFAAVNLTPAPVQAKVLVIGVDGASWNAIDPMLEAGELPNLRALIALGGSAELTTVEPLTSPVVWTSIATGRRPEVHGITDFFSTRATIAVPTIYERLAAKGLRVGLYDVLMSWPPPPLPGGFVVPGWLRRDESTWPPDALDELSIFRTVYKGKPSNREYHVQANAEVAEKAASWKQLDQRFDPEVAALTFYAVDATSHRYWHASFPEDFETEQPEFDATEERAVQQSLRGVDRSIGLIVSDLDLTGPDSVLIVSDHGFRAEPDGVDVWTTQFQDVLDANDLVPGRDPFTLVSTFFAVTIRIAPGPFAERDRLIDRLETLLDSYRFVDGDRLLYTTVLDVAERPAEFRRPLLSRIRQWAVRRLMSWAFSTKTDPTSQAMIVALPKFSALADLWPDGEIEVDGQRMPLRKAIYRQRFTGTHDETAVFIAAGGVIEKQTKRDRLSVLDIAPLVAYLANSAIPSDLEGAVPTRWIKSATLDESPPTMMSVGDWPEFQETTTGTGQAGSDSGSQDPELIEKLRALGYIQ